MMVWHRKMPMDMISIRPPSYMTSPARRPRVLKVTIMPPKRKNPRRTKRGLRRRTPRTASAVNIPAKAMGISISFSMMVGATREVSEFDLAASYWLSEPMGVGLVRVFLHAV